MRNFVRDAAIFLGINFTILALLYWRYGVSEDYLASANDKIDLVEKTKPARVLLIGGSSVAWSTHSEVIHEQLNLPTINCAYHAGLGIGFREREVTDFAKPDDIVVLSIEWGAFPDQPRARIVAELFAAAPRTIRFMNPRDRKLITDGMLAAVRMPEAALVQDFKKNKFAAFSRESARAAKTIRLRSKFNEYGDFEGHYGVKPFGFKGKGMEFPTLEQLRRTIDRLNKLHAWCEAQGVEIVYLVPFIPESINRDNLDTVNLCMRELRSKLTIPILNPDQYLMPDAAYFDSAYHLRDFAGRCRTKMVANWLQEFLNVKHSP